MGQELREREKKKAQDTCDVNTPLRLLQQAVELYLILFTLRSKVLEVMAR